MDVEKNIRAVCDQRKVSIPDIAKNIGMSPSGLYSAIGNNSIKFVTLKKIAEYLEVSIEYLIGTEPITTDVLKVNDEYNQILKADMQLNLKSTVLTVEIEALKKQITALSDSLNITNRENADLKAQISDYDDLVKTIYEKLENVVDKKKLSWERRTDFDYKYHLNWRNQIIKEMINQIIEKL